MRTIVIGDIHGGYKALTQLIERIQLQDTDQLIFLGDYVDGWSENYEVVDFLITLSRKRTNDNHTAPIFLRGNHDALVLDYFVNNVKDIRWREHGGDSTIASYKNKSKQEIQAHIDFLTNELLDYLELDGNGYFHAGFQNLKGPQYEYHPNVVYWDRTLWEVAVSLDPNLQPEDDCYPDRLKLYKEIFIGHTPTSRLGVLEPLNKVNVWNMDTAAAYMGPLSAMCVETKEVWQSDPVHSFYPGESGRN
ncbi:MAG: metallophosphoesterase [Nonlabens sp.]|nr:metallophosphoesterase [Nonlabens sp.]